MSVHVFGVRHHGPGSARNLRAALEELQPDLVLVEGPPDAHGVLPLMLRKEMRPPVALLIYRPDAPRQAAFYPFTVFSPEWQALHYALSRDLPARFMDLPQAIQMVREATQDKAETTPTDPAQSESSAAKLAQFVSPIPASKTAAPENDDPLAWLARAAGYSNTDQWWEQHIEQRRDAAHVFEAVLEAMTALRAERTVPLHDDETLREAHMRQTIRAAKKEGFERIAVVCGAWHAPALIDIDPAKNDESLLKGLKRVKVEATWIPWTNSRLSYRSGYGAGVSSPGWYEHLWTAPAAGLAVRWLTQAAHLLRQEGLDASSASIIEAVRLADALAAMRDLPMPGMAELHEAIETVLCNGNAAPLVLIRSKLEIGEKLGAVPPETPAVPLQRDLEARQRRLRLEPSTEIVTRDLDLRNDTDRARSRLLHCLRLLNIDWGTPKQTAGPKKGSFHEIWQVQWQVEFIVSLIEANVWGNTVETAAAACACHRAAALEAVSSLSDLLDQVVLAGLPDAIDYTLACVQRRAAISADVRHLMDALPSLARVARYGDVRQTRAEQILPIIDGLFERVVIGLPGACASLDDDTAQQMVTSIDHVQESVSLLDRQEQLAAWQHVQRLLIERDSIHGLVRGRCCRLLLEQRVLDEAELQRLARLALSPVTPAPQAAAWVEGVLRGSGLQLLHLDGLWLALDNWLCELSEDVFKALLPLLRRAFAGFHAPERRKMGEKARHLRSQPLPGHRTMSGNDTLSDIQRERANLVVPVLAQILGVVIDGN